MKTPRLPIAFVGILAIIFTTLPLDAAEPRWLAGAAKVDITPDYPVRLSGYGSRRTESDARAIRIQIRAALARSRSSTATRLPPRPRAL
ncbi:MAG: hypothetical protein NTV08_10540 [Verrucomicrobia bacterium]|nr:hypothetical protein [Verrucomicrobiota bacterium]